MFDRISSKEKEASIYVRNDFDKHLMIVYEDRNYRFLIIPPEKEEAISYLARGRLDKNLIQCYLYDPKYGRQTSIPFKDLRLQYRPDA